MRLASGVRPYSWGSSNRPPAGALGRRTTLPWWTGSQVSSAWARAASAEPRAGAGAIANDTFFQPCPLPISSGSRHLHLPASQRNRSQTWRPHCHQPLNRRTRSLKSRRRPHRCFFSRCARPSRSRPPHPPASHSLSTSLRRPSPPRAARPMPPRSRARPTAGCTWRTTLARRVCIPCSSASAARPSARRARCPCDPVLRNASLGPTSSRQIARPCSDG